VDVLVVDTGWRQNASTGYQPNFDLFPDLPRFFSEVHAKNARVVFNDHPEPVAASALDPAEVTYRYTNLAQITAEGLDAWWYDRNWGVSLLSPASNLRKEVWGMKIYQDEAIRANAPLRPLMMANVDGIDNGYRNRAPDVAAHRYSIQWTGDIGPGNNYLNFAVKNAVHAGVQALFPYESDDLGGHTSDPGPGDYIRWIEYGALSPIYRPHCTLGLSRMPWTFGPQAEWIARRFINLRYRLLPEFYCAARNSFDTGEPILRRLDLDYPQYVEASQESQYLIGHSLLVAPVLQNEIGTIPSAWLTTTNGQPGLNASYFANTVLTGPPIVTRIDTNIDFNWGTGSPDDLVGSDNFTARWTGNITVPASIGDVTLCAVSDDGIRVWVDNQLCIDNWGPNNASITESAGVLKAGVTHQLRVEYLEIAGNAVVSLKWRSQNTQQPVWIPPGNWINAWTGTVLKGPLSTYENPPIERIPLYIHSGSIFALAPQMQFTGEKPWSPVTLDVYPSTSEIDQTTLYEDDTLTTAYKQGQFRTTLIKTWANGPNKTVSIAINPAVGSFSNALTQRSWVARLRRPPEWSTDLAPTSVTLNGQSIGPIMRRIKNASAMPLGADNGAPDADVFEIVIPTTSVLTSNLLIASFTPVANSWTCGDIGATGANGNVIEGASTSSNSMMVVRGGGSGFTGTNDGFHFIFQPSAGNVQATVKLEKQSSVNALAASGLMIREDLTPASRAVMLGVTSAGQGFFLLRTTNGSASQINSSATLSVPCWLRLVRNGNAFTSLTSTNNITWTALGSATLPGFSTQSYIGAAVSDAITNSVVLSTNSFGTAIVGAAAKLSGGIYGVDNTNINTAIFSGLTLANTVRISSVLNQTTPQSTATPPIAFTASATSGNQLSISASSSNTNLLGVSEIIITGSGSNYSVTLAPRAGKSGTAIVTLTAGDGISSASTQFTLTVPSLTGLLLKEDFSNYAPGNVPDQAYSGSGFSPHGSWTGLNSTFNSGVQDAATVSDVSLSWGNGAITSSKVIMKGDGSNLKGVPDLSSNGLFAAAGLLDPVSGTIGGGAVSESLYVSFLIRAVANTRNSEYGGLHLSRSDDSTGVLIGNEWNAIAYSLWYPQTKGVADLLNNSGNYAVMDNKTHLVVARINYMSGDDTLTAWLDPNPSLDENAQSSSSTFIGSVSGNLSFDRFFFRGGNNNSFEYGALRFGTSWASVLPVAGASMTASSTLIRPPFVEGGLFAFSFNGSPGRNYTITTNTNLSSGNWTTVAGGTFGAGADALYYGILAADSQRFYRISMP